jgi:hypothetical protein
MIVTLNYAKEEQPKKMINYEKIDVFMTTTDGNVVKNVKWLFLLVFCSQWPMAHKGIHHLHSPLPSPKAILGDQHTHPPATENLTTSSSQKFSPHI